MKKIIFTLFIGLFLLSSCKEGPVQELVLLPVTEVIEIPTRLEYQNLTNFKVKFEFPNDCYRFHGFDFTYFRNERTIAVRALKILDATCNDGQLFEFTASFQMMPEQEDEYIFKFWKGKDTNGNDIFETYVLPVY